MENIYLFYDRIHAYIALSEKGKICHWSSGYLSTCNGNLKEQLKMHEEKFLEIEDTLKKNFSDTEYKIIRLKKECPPELIDALKKYGDSMVQNIENSNYIKGLIKRANSLLFNVFKEREERDVWSL
jgi:hypothetical protein